MKLIERIRSGYYHPGDRFFSNRSVSSHFKISYKTAHILLKELEEEGCLDRSAQSGTYMKGHQHKLQGVALYFNERAKISDSFGDNLSRQLIHKLNSEKIQWKLIWVNPDQELLDGYFPVIWESQHIQHLIAKEERFALLLNERPEPGLISLWIDSIALDGFSGAASAAQIIDRRYYGKNICIYSGPESDYRNNDRVNGFLSIIPETEVVSAGSWDFSDGVKNAGKILRLKPDAIFCCNDRLAYSLFKFCDNNNIKTPAIMGFDNAPVSEKIGFSTIAIPWDDMITLAVQTIKQRLLGDTSSTKQSFLNTRPFLRGSSFY